jgi:hypothetical protein
MKTQPPDDDNVETIARGTHEGHRRAVADSGLMKLLGEALVRHGGEAARSALFKWVGAKLVMLLLGGAFAGAIVLAVKAGWIK